MPPENVYALSEVSPKSLYYMAEGLPDERLKNLIIYIDDAREEHIPVLKTFRNDSEVTPRNCTTVDGEFLELTIEHRPIVMASSVTAPRDLEQQLGSRTFLITVQDASEEEEKLVRATIRQRAEVAALMTEQEDHGLEILHQVARTLRDEGVRDVVIPFDVGRAVQCRQTRNWTVHEADQDLGLHSPVPEANARVQGRSKVRPGLL